MTRWTLGLVIALFTVVGCASGSSPSQAGSVATPQPTITVEDTPEPDPIVDPSPTPQLKLPKSYAKLAKRDWAKVVKAPDKYIGKGYQLWACITQFDAATGTDSFRGDASYRKETYWSLNGDNAFFNGTEKQLSDFVTGDIVQMNVVDLGSFSYDTQAGGNTTVPLFYVTKITRKGSCD